KLFLFILLASGTINAQRTLFEDGFETYPDFAIDHVGGWIMLDLDGNIPISFNRWENHDKPQAFIIFNRDVAIKGSIYYDLSSEKTDLLRARTGPKCAASFSNKIRSLKTKDDWLISPPITLGALSNELRFWVRDRSVLGGKETYEVVVYKGTGNPTASSDFETIEGNVVVVGLLDELNGNWLERIFNLDAYAGETIRIGIHHTETHYRLMIDDFKVTTGTLSTTDFFAKNFSVFPNPAQDVLNIVAKNGMEIKGIQVTDLNGRIVKSVAVQTQPEAQINIADLSAGMYFVSAQTNEGTAISKFLKN
ncbi:choice-of-anchor J domain-containing protein, partial [Flavobacterium sp.]|uniref:T9SS-dependent choice-of-anchor J family protein n=1 Tax=Flavobacterium sp. TaxID=239 RepID=UPI00260D049F